MVGRWASRMNGPRARAARPLQGTISWQNPAWHGVHRSKLTTPLRRPSVGRRRLLRRLCGGLLQQLLGQRPLAGGVELLQLVAQDALVDRLAPAVQRREAEAAA